jgi:hypothetical protein
MGRALTWIIFGAVLGVALFAGVDALRSSLRDAPTAVKTTPAVNGSIVVSGCEANQLEAAIEVRKPDDTRPVWNQREARGWRAWQRTPVATLVMRNVGSRDCILSEGTFDFGIKDRAGRWMARWNGDNVFPGLYAPEQERSFSLPNVFSCDRPSPFSARATVGGYSARLNELAYDDVTCLNGRLTES